MLLTAIVGAAIIALMYALDATEIGLMPTRGTPSLWPVRILTDFGKVGLCAVGPGRAVVRGRDDFPAIAGNRAIPAARPRHAAAVYVFRRAGAGSRRRVIKWIVGRGRPFVGGEGNVFNFTHFNGTEAYASFPSGHAITELCAGFRGFGASGRGHGL